jgi:hypothetical protein
MAINTNFPNVRPSLLLDFANSQQLDPRVTFSRSTTAPYYDGKTSVLAEQNLYTNSQNIINGTWNPGNTTLTVNATTAPDGTTTATLAVPNTSNVGHNISQSALGNLTGTYTFSVYVKPSGYTTFIIANSAQTLRASFDLTAVTNTNTGAVTSTITAVQNGFYRVTLTATISADFFYFFINGLGAYIGDGTSGVYLWGFQAEQRSSATAYNATTTTALTNYIPQLLFAPINAPRIDYNPTTFEPLGLLIEQSSTNIALYSNSVSGTGWSSNGGTVIQNYAIAPDGSQTASYFYGTVNPARYQTTTVTASTTYTSSVYYKTMSAVSGSTLTIGTDTVASLACTARFDLNTNALIFSGSSVIGTSITSVGNGWYRASVTYTITAITTIANIVYVIIPSGYVQVLIWGSQLEALAFPTSYIPTTTAQVTRASDNASMTGTNFSSWFNASQGTIFSDYLMYKSGITAGVYCFNNGTTSNRIELRGAVSGGDYEAIVVTSGTTVADLYSGSGTTVIPRKNAFSYNANNFASSLSGATPQTSSSGAVPTVNQLFIGSLSAGTSLMNGWLKKFSYYPQAVTNAQLQALTGS